MTDGSVAEVIKCVSRQRSLERTAVSLSKSQCRVVSILQELMGRSTGSENESRFKFRNDCGRQDSRETVTHLERIFQVKRSSGPEETQWKSRTFSVTMAHEKTDGQWSVKDLLKSVEN